MLRKNFVSFLALLIGVTALSTSIVVKFSAPKLGYVDNNALYKSFKGKADLEKEYMKEKSREQSYMDSIYITLVSEENSLKTASASDVSKQRMLLDKKRAFEDLSKKFDERNKELQDRYLEQIWSQINQYVKEYGKENNYDFIFGATGNGTIMHANEKNDITKEVLKYINSRYEGK